MTKKTLAERRIEKMGQIVNALIEGINNGLKYTKPYDKAIAIKVTLKQAGFTIVRGRAGQANIFGIVGLVYLGLMLVVLITIF